MYITGTGSVNEPVTHTTFPKTAFFDNLSYLTRDYYGGEKVAVLAYVRHIFPGQ